jgi:hypothetical protein
MRDARGSAKRGAPGQRPERGLIKKGMEWKRKNRDF